MKKLLFLTTFAFLGLLSSCQDEIDITLPDGQERLIINGKVMDNEFAFADLSWSINYLSQEENPSVLNANILVFEDEILWDSLLHVENGHYVGQKMGEIGRNYFIEVNIPESLEHPFGIWKSQNEKLNRNNPIDSIYSLYLPQAPFQREGFYVYAHWTEPSGLGDCYRFKEWENDTLENAPFNLQVTEDKFFDGRSFNDIDLDALNVAGPERSRGNSTGEDQIGTKYSYEISSISLSHHDYINLIQEQTLQVGGLFDPPAAPIVGNIYRGDDTEDYALGYFYATAPRKSHIIITP